MIGNPFTFDLTLISRVLLLTVEEIAAYSIFESFTTQLVSNEEKAAWACSLELCNN